MATTFDSQVNVNVVFTGEAARFDGFGTVVALYNADPGRTNPFLAGDRYRRFSSTQELDAAVAANEMTAAEAEMFTVAFAQPRPPSSILIAQYDGTWGGAALNENPSVALDAMITAGEEFYGVAHVGACDIEAIRLLDTWLTQKRYIVGFVSEDTPLYQGSAAANSVLDGSIYGSGAELDVTALANADKILKPYYHDDIQSLSPTAGDTGNAQALAGMVARLGFDPDLTTAGFEGEVRGIASYTTPLTQTQVETNNANFYGTFGGVPYVSPGQMISGRPANERVSVDWFAIRLTEDLIQLKIRRDAEGQIIPLTVEGQEIVRGAFLRRLAIGAALLKFDQAESFISFPFPIPATDIDAERFSASGKLCLIRGGRIFDIDLSAEVC